MGHTHKAGKGLMVMGATPNQSREDGWDSAST